MGRERGRERQTGSQTERERVLLVVTVANDLIEAVD